MWINDWGLKVRMYLTFILLALIYLAFLTILAAMNVRFESLLIIAAVMILMQYYFSDKLVLWSVGAKIVSKDDAPELYSIVEKLVKRANLPMPRIAIVDTPIPNAFATGRSPKAAVVAVTTGLLRTLNKEEIEAVLGHEISHIKNRDMAVLTIASIISTLAFFIMRWAMFMGMFGDRREGNYASFLFIISALVWFISFLLIRALSRYREYAADAGSAILTRNPRALISALLKISGRMKFVSSNEKAKVEGMNAFFIIPAISGKTILSLFSTHPPIEKRIERLERLARDLEF
ncbi:zinc metalloprotease HtpX [Archaeoglobales archaeon ex4484_92]|nr:MAG: zinc metalloprotease HtpX [Archaeoglobales archaeon ex4484_92]